MVRLIDSKKLGDILKLLITIVLIIILNQISDLNFFRIDLTEEKRYTVSNPTKAVLSEIDETIYVDVYLEGQLPAGFKRLQKSIRETLDEFNAYSGNRIQYQFIDPESAVSTESRNEFMFSIAEKGIQPTDVFLTENGSRTQKRILPGAIISYRGREKGVQLLKGNRGAPSEVRLNQSIEGVEYELISGIQSLIKNDYQTVGYLVGHGEATGGRISAFRQMVEERAVFQELDLSTTSAIDPSLDVVVVAKPKARFSQSDKYKLDQYLMNGGNLAFFIDVLEVDLDSARSGTYSFPYDHDLDDLLFRYGVRINKDLVQDLQSGAIPVVVGNFGEESQIKLLPWPFYPIVNVYSSHPVTRNLDASLLKFASTIDTVKATGVSKTPLLFSSPYSLVLSAPVRVDVSELQEPRPPSEYKVRNLPLAYLLAGEFTSLFKNRPLPPQADESLFMGSGEGKLIVVSDGDILLNDLNPQTGQPQMLGFDLNTNQQYANDDFVQNMLDYLTDDQGLILARNKEVVIRPLDKSKIQNQQKFWKSINLVLPIILVILFGITKWFLRARYYQRD